MLNKWQTKPGFCERSTPPNAAAVQHDARERPLHLILPTRKLSEPGSQQGSYWDR
jgi:hypothetical protein